MHQIGAGVLGPVFRAYSPTHDRPLAVKAFHIDITPEQAQTLTAAFERLVAAGAFHPGVVPAAAAGVDDGMLYLAQEYVAAESLDASMRDYAPLALDAALPLIDRLAGALDAAHARDLVHGGLHLRDIFVTPSGGRMTGLGVVAALEDVGVTGPIRRPYTAPELIARRSWGPPADRFALAAVAYELLTGKRAAGTGTQVAARLDELQDVDDVEALQAVFETALADSPDSRYASAARFATDLRAAVGRPADGDEAEDEFEVEPPEYDPAPPPAIRATGDPLAGAGPAAVLDAPREPVESGAAAAPAGEIDLHRPLGETAADPAGGLPHEAYKADEADRAFADAALDAAKLVAEPAPEPVPEPRPEPAPEPRLEPRVEPVSDASPRPAARRREYGEAPAEAEDPGDAGSGRSGRPLVGYRDLPPAGAAPGGLPAPSSDDDLVGAGDDEVPYRPWAFGSVLAAVAVLAAGAVAAYLVGVRLASEPGLEGGPMARVERPQPGGAPVPASGPPPAGAAAPPAAPAAPPPGGAPGTPATAGSAPAPEPAPSALASARGRPAPPPPASARGEDAPAAAGVPDGVEIPDAPELLPVEQVPLLDEVVADATPPAGPAGAAAGSGWLLVRSTPPGAEVAIDGVDQGRTPLALRDMPFDTYRVEVRLEGFRSQTRELALGPGAAVAAVEVELARGADPPPAPVVGAIDVQSRPPGARVLLDGREVGTTPVVVPDVAAGAHELRLELDGYRPWVAAVDVPAEERIRIGASLDLSDR